MAYDPLEGMSYTECYSSGLAAITTGLLLGPPREVQQDEIGKLLVSTIEAIEGWYETAICYGETEWHVHPVERYRTEAEALEGHALWLTLIPALTEITDIGYGALTPAKQIKIKEAVANVS